MTREIQIIDFETERELWNRYELIEGGQIKAKVVLMKALERKNPQKPKEKHIGIESKALVTVIPIKNSKLWGTPSKKEVTPNEMAKAEQIEVSFDQVSEDWNIYRLEDGRKLKIKLVVTGIVRLKGLYDVTGLPVYNIGSTVIFNIVGKKK